ncbi:MAG: pilus assembly protein PilX [Clostridia bacterium]|nr:pilus assembly protein PilX [Clostridia bacterium]
MLRKINAAISILLIVIYMLHGVLGSFTLLEISPWAGKALARFGLVLIGIHVLLGAILTVQAFRVSAQKGEKYYKQNALFWTRRISGLVLALCIAFHIGAFGETKAGRYVLVPFTTLKLIAQLMLIASLFIHIFINIRPLMLHIGSLKFRERRIDIFLALSVLLLFFTATMIIYYIGWHVL